VLSPAFNIELRGQNVVAFVWEVEAEAVRIVRKYSMKTEMPRNWDIRGPNVRLNRVFELNGLLHGAYPEDSAEAGDDRRKKRVATRVDECCSK
jgi:hypothetical protein